MKKTLACGVLGVSLVLLTGCTGASNDAKLSSLLVDAICISSDALSNMPDFSTMSAEELTKASTDMEKKADDMKKTIEELPKKYGFASDADVEKAMTAVANKEEFKKKVRTDATAKCAPKADILDGMLSEVK